MSEAQPNPYNARKEWHNVKETEFRDSNSLFVPTLSNMDTGPDSDPDTQSATSAEDTQYKKRYDDLKKHYDNTVTSLRQEVRDLNAQMEVQKPSYVPPKTREEVAAYAQANPELTEVIETITHTNTESMQKDLEEIKARENKLLAKEARSYLMNAHPDFEEIKNKPEFHDWAETQPKNIKDWIYNNPYDGELAASAVTLFKAAQGLVSNDINQSAAPRNEKPDAASLVPTRQSGANASERKRIWSRAEIKKMPMHLYEKYEDEIDQAIFEGRITN